MKTDRNRHGAPDTRRQLSDGRRTAELHTLRHRSRGSAGRAHHTDLVGSEAIRDRSQTVPPSWLLTLAKGATAPSRRLNS